jgi:hypothetical protein
VRGWAKGRPEISDGEAAQIVRALLESKRFRVAPVRETLRPPPKLVPYAGAERRQGKDLDRSRSKPL